MNLSYIFGKILRGEELSCDEIQLAEALAASEDAEEAIMAHSVLLRIGDSDQKVIAFARLLRICEEGSIFYRDTTAAIFLLILEHFSKPQFQASPCFADFAYRAAKHSFVGARINAMRVLRQLASISDQKAIELLRRSIADPNPSVSSAAKTALKLAGV